MTASAEARLDGAIRTVAIIEAAKGAIVLLAGFGLLSLVHHDVQHFAERLVAHSHMNPGSHYPRIFLDASARVTDSRLMLLAAGAALYSLVRLVEAYGLWHTRSWAEWLAAVSGAIYIPFELLELHHRFRPIGLAVLVVNVAIVAIMLYAVLRRRRRQARPGGH